MELSTCENILQIIPVLLLEENQEAIMVPLSFVFLYKQSLKIKTSNFITISYNTESGFYTS